MKSLDLRFTELAIQPIDAVYLAPDSTRRSDARDRRARACGRRNEARRARGPAKRCASIVSATRRGCLRKSVSMSWPSSRCVRGSCSPAHAALDARDLVPLAGIVRCAHRRRRIRSRGRKPRRKRSRRQQPRSQSKLNTPVTADMTPVRNAIIVLSRFGIAGSAPLPFWRHPTRCLPRRARSRRKRSAESSARRPRRLRSTCCVPCSAMGFSRCRASRWPIRPSSRNRSRRARRCRAAIRSRCIRGSSRCSACASQCRGSARACTRRRLRAPARRCASRSRSCPHVEGERWVGLPADPAMPDAGRQALARRACGCDAQSHAAARRCARSTSGSKSSRRRAKRLPSRSSTMRPISARRR